MTPESAVQGIRSNEKMRKDYLLDDVIGESRHQASLSLKCLESFRKEIRLDGNGCLISSIVTEISLC